MSKSSCAAARQISNADWPRWPGSPTGRCSCAPRTGFSLPIPAVEQVRHERFAGPHPAGTVGLHIHTLDPAGRGRLVWHVGYQDTLAIGRLFESGSIDVERVVSLAGPAVDAAPSPADAAWHDDR